MEFHVLGSSYVSRSAKPLGKKVHLKISVDPPPPRGSRSDFPAPRLCLDSSRDLGQFAQEVTPVVAATSDSPNWERDPLTCQAAPSAAGPLNIGDVLVAVGGCR